MKHNSTQIIAILMKRLMAFFMLIFFSIIICASAFADEIQFRGLPWGISPQEANKTIVETKPTLQNTTKGALLRYPTGAKESVLDNEKNFWSDNYEYFAQNDVVLSVAAVFDSNSDANVGGYKLDTMFLYFSYDIVDGQINYNEDNTHFAVAEYNFDIIDGDTAAGNLTEKLTSLYGQAKEYASEESASLFYDGTAHPYTKYSSVTVFDGDNGTHAQLIHVKTVYTEANEETHSLTIQYWCDQYEMDIIKADIIVRDGEYNTALEQEYNVDQGDMNGL